MAQNNLLEKTKLSGAMQEITSQELQKKAEQAYKTLLFENDLSDKMQAKHLKQAILPAVAVYTTLLEDNWLKEDAFELIRKSVLDAAKPMAKAFQSMGRLPFLFLGAQKNVSCIHSLSIWISRMEDGVETKRSECNRVGLSLLLLC